MHNEPPHQVADAERPRSVAWVGKALGPAGSAVCIRSRSAWALWLTKGTAALLLPFALTIEPLQFLGVNDGTRTGVWQCKLTRPDGEMPFALDLTQSGDQVTGRLSSPEGQLIIAPSTLKNRLLTLRSRSTTGTYILTAKSSSRALTDGLVTLDGKPYGNWHGDRAPPPGTNGGIESLADGRIRPASFVQTADGVIHMAYTFRRRTIKYLAFDETWIKGGVTRGEFKGDRAK